MGGAVEGADVMAVGWAGCLTTAGSGVPFIRLVWFPLIVVGGGAVMVGFF